MTSNTPLPEPGRRQSYGIALLDTARRFLGASDAFAALAGYARHELHGRDLCSLISLYDEPMTGTGATASEWNSYPVDLVRSDGDKLHVFATLTPIRSSPHDHVGYVLRIELAPGEDVGERVSEMARAAHSARPDEALREVFTAIGSAAVELGDLVEGPESRSRVVIIRAAVRSGLSILGDMESGAGS